MARTINTLDNPFVLTGGSQTTGGGVRDTGGTFTPTTETSGSFPNLNIYDINIDSAEANAPNPRITANPNISAGYGDYNPKEYDSSYTGPRNGTTGPRNGTPKNDEYNYDYYGNDQDYYGYYTNSPNVDSMPCPAGQEYIQPNCIQAPCPGYCAPIETATDETAEGQPILDQGPIDGATSPGGPAPAPPVS